jgi:hydroxymethylglutaryl-CoA reductase (NADPH)
MPDAIGAASVKHWIEEPENFSKVRKAFESTTSFGKLQTVKGAVAGRNVYLRFVCFSGDAMGMNMVSKGCLAVIDVLQEVFPEMELIAISGNMCTDKKPAAINWIDGRGKSIVCEARIPGRFVESTLKTTVQALVETNIQKNLIGSAMAGALGGFNAHASNIVTAIFLATGQDPAQNVESSMCMTIMEEIDGDLLVSVNMPCIEVGTIGGGTSLPAQGACLDVIGCRGASKPPAPSGSNARQLAQVVAGAVLAGELSLMAALASNQLVRAHMQHNRKK